MDSIEALIRSKIARLSQDMVASRMGMKPCTVSRILSGSQGIPLEKLGAFLKAVDLDVLAEDADVVRVGRDHLRALKLLARSSLDIEGEG